MTRDSITDEKYYTLMDVLKIGGVLLIIAICCIYVFGKLFGVL
jgi:hypothetical protein